MIYSNLDTIIRNNLLKKGLPIHYYFEFLVHSANCLRILHISKLKIVNTVRLTVNDYGAVDLPDDFLDDVAVTIPVGQLLKPIAKKDTINPVRATDSAGNFTTYTEANGGDTPTQFAPWSWLYNVNEYGENLGRNYGSGGGSTSNGYEVIKERRQIQLSETFTSEEIVLMYITDGQSIDNASQVDTMAIETIQAFINWQRSPNADYKSSPEAATFYNESRTLAARLNDLTTTDVRDIIYKNYVATAK
jgi:hypothetical protein